MGTYPEVVVFDLDDTLYMEHSYVKSGFEAVGEYVLHTYGVRDFVRTAWSKFEAGARGRVFDLALEHLHRNDLMKEVPSLVRVYREHEPKIFLTPDSAEVLAELIDRVQLGMITDGPPVSQERKVRALGLSAIIKEIIVTGEYGEDRVKPNPWGYEEIEQRCGATGNVCAYIGDNPTKDFIGARGRGWSTIRVRREGGLHYSAEALPGYEADCDVPDVYEAMKHLGLWKTNSPIECSRIGGGHSNGQ